MKRIQNLRNVDDGELFAETTDNFQQLNTFAKKGSNMDAWQR